MLEPTQPHLIRHVTETSDHCVPEDESSCVTASQNRRFATTQWSLVLEAGNRNAPEADQALSELCAAYWMPLYSFARRKGYSTEDASDRTQEFFARLIEKSFLATADPQRGRFRTFLLTLFQRFLAKEFEKGRAIKRGGASTILAFDFDGAESQWSTVLSDDKTAERIFEQQWAMTLLHRVVGLLNEEYRSKGKGELFNRCRIFLNGGSSDGAYVEVARDLKMSEGALRVAVHRLRERFRGLLRQEVAGTVASEQEVDDELMALRRAISGPS
jgi:RNA polymerase sigma-70 factor (ECF subfamily)